MEIIYHIAKSDWWNKFSSSDSYETETLTEEGFIHCSTKEQVTGVLERYFTNQKELVLLHIDTTKLIPELKYEEATFGQLFPHVYGSINRTAIIRVENLQ